MTGLVRRVLRWVRTPAVQLAGAVGVMVFGAALIALWVVGVMLIVGGVLWAVDALLREPGRGTDRLGSHDGVLERWRRAR